MITICIGFCEYLAVMSYYTLKVNIFTSLVSYVQMLVKWDEQDNNTHFKNLLARKKNYFMPLTKTEIEE
jgi:hypothetical protein